MNLLTEDNLPYYSRDIDGVFGRDGSWGEWARRWTAEEGRHSIVIRDYLTVTRALDPVELERGRMAQVSKGEVPAPTGRFNSVVYLTLQELATRIAHRNTGKLLDDPVGYELMARVAADENFHHLFYRDLASAAIELDPSATMIAIDHEVRSFAMPGTGIPNFDVHCATHRPRRHLRPQRPPRADPRADRDASVEGRGAHWSERRSRESPRSAPRLPRARRPSLCSPRAAT